MVLHIINISVKNKNFYKNKPWATVRGLLHFIMGYVRILTMKKILIYLKDYKKETILAPLFKLLEASFELIVPLVVAAMIDTGIANEDKAFIWKMGI